MPIPAILGAAGALGSAAIGAVSQGSQNRRSQRWSERMYQRQYNDNINFWRMQNEYNDPSQQMARLKGAGLNPHLVYGGSSGGTAGTAGPVAKADTPTPQFTPVLDNTDVLSRYNNYQLQQAQVDNLLEQTNAIKSKVALDLANAIFTGARTKKTAIETDQLKEMFSYSLDALKASTQKTLTDTAFTANENERKNTRLGYDIRESAERILNSRIGRQQTQALIRNTNLGSDLKELDKKLYERNLRPNDNVLFRLLSGILDKYNIKLPEKPRSKINGGSGW